MHRIASALLVASMVSAQHAHGDASGAAAAPAAGAATEPGASVSAKATPAAQGPTWYGLSPSVSQGFDFVLNAEPDNANITESTGLGLRWSLGKLFFAKSYVEPLTASLDWNFSAEMTGTSDAYRGTNYDGGGSSASGFLQFEPVPQRCYDAIQQGETVGNDCFPRQIDAAAQKRVNYGDMKLGLSHGKLATIPWTAVVVNGKVSMTLPTSLQSRNEQLVTTLGWGGGLSRTFLGDKLSLSYGLSFSKPLRGSDTFVIVDSDDPDPSYNGSDDPQFYSPDYGTSRFTTFSIANSFTASYALPWHLGASLSYTITDGWKESIDNQGQCEVELQGSSTPTADVCENRFAEIDTGNTIKPSQLFLASLSYDPLDWLSLGLSLATDTPVRKPNSSDFYQPFLHTDRNGFSSLGLSAAVTFDRLYVALR